MNQLDPKTAKHVFSYLNGQLSLLKDISEQIDFPHNMRDLLEGDAAQLVRYGSSDAHLDAGFAIGFVEGLATGLQCSLDELLQQVGVELPKLKELPRTELEDSEDREGEDPEGTNQGGI